MSQEHKPVSDKKTVQAVSSLSTSPVQDAANDIEEIRLNNNNNNTKIIKIVTFNVYYDNFKNQDTLDCIGSFDADIVALQETNPSWQKSIENHQPICKKFKHIYWAHDHLSVIGGSILLSKYPILSFDLVERFHKAWYRAFKFLIKLDNNLLQLHHIHLIAPFPPMGVSKNMLRLREIKHFLRDFSPVHFVKKGLLDNNHDQSESSSQESKDEENDANELICVQVPTIVCGDFNCSDGSCHEFLLNDLKFERAVSAISSGCCCTHIPATWKGMLCMCCCCAPKCFDNIYFKGMHCVDSKVLQQGESDHWPVWAQFVVPSTTIVPM